MVLYCTIFMALRVECGFVKKFNFINIEKMFQMVFLPVFRWQYATHSKEKLSLGDHKGLLSSRR